MAEERLVKRSNRDSDAEHRINHKRSKRVCKALAPKELGHQQTAAAA